MIFTTLLIIATGALEGRSRIAESIFWGEVAPNAVRIVLLPLVAVLNLPETYVAHVLTLSVLLPWLWLARRMCDRSVRGWQSWSGWDFTYCSKFVVATLFANQLGAADIVIASVLFSSEIVADYAVAARLAALFTFFQLALLKRFAPRAGHLLQRKDANRTASGIRFVPAFDDRLRRIDHRWRSAAGACVIAFAWQLSGRRGLLIWLAIPSFVMSFYATSDRLLIIAGQANVALVVTATSFIVLIASPFATAPWLGPIAIPAAMIFSVLFVNPLVAVRTRQLLGLRTFALRDWALMACGGISLVGFAVGNSYLNALITCGILGVIGAYYIITATARSAVDDYDNSRIFRAEGSSASPPLLAPDKASK